MADEPENPETEPTEPDEAGATTAEVAPAGEEDKEKEKLHQTVEIKDIGPCKKHIKVTVERKDIDELLEEKYKELMVDQPAQIPGFRPGKAPKQIVVRKYHKEVTSQVKGQVLMASLEQLADEHDIAPLSAPNIDYEKLDIPKEGPFSYEFDVEVRPAFELPNYKGLKLKRPVKTFTDVDVDKEQDRILIRFGELVPKEKGMAELGDYIVADMTTKYQDKVIGTAKDTTLRVDDTLAFKDGIADKFGEQLKGAKPGDKRTIDIVLSDSVAVPQIRGQRVQAVLDIKDIKRMKLPELTHDFLHLFGVHNIEQFREKVRGLLESRLEYHQRQAARQQVLQLITAAADWELPNDMLMRQARKAMARRVMEMQEAGMSESEIQARQRLLEQDVLRSTAQTLKEHFVLQKIAETEEIETSEEDLDAETERIADQTNQSPRRVRAQIEKDDLMDALYAQITERKVLDVILESAGYEDVPLEPEKGVGTAETQAVEGELKDPTAAPPAAPTAAPPEEAPSPEAKESE